MTNDLSKIKERWELPKAYIKYISKHDKGQYIEGENFVNGLYLNGASDLIQKQEGYSYNPIEKKVIEGWPKNYVVIADDGADPYVLDLSKSDGNDAPVLFAYHGEDEWDFEEYSQSFTKFIKDLGIS